MTTTFYIQLRFDKTSTLFAAYHKYPMGPKSLSVISLKNIPILFIAMSFLAFIPTGPATHHDQSVAVDSTASTSQIEKQAFDQVNEHRKSIGLSPLVVKKFMIDLARQHSKDMASGKVEFGHDGADDRFKIIEKTVKQMQGAGENVFKCTGNYSNLAQTAVEGWLASPGHRENIEADFNISGMGVARSADGEYYFTQIFAKEKE